MKIENIDVHSYPGSEKYYMNGESHPVRVAMRKVNLTPTARKMADGTTSLTDNGSVLVYDTSGVYTDPSVKVDINEGIPRLREQWIAGRDDIEQLPDISSDYGRARRDDPKLREIRFPK